MIVSAQTEYHRECNRFGECVRVLGPGQDECYREEDCRGPIPPDTKDKTGITNPAISKDLTSGEGADIIALLIANALKIIFSLSGLILLMMIIVGGVQWMTAGGNAEALAKAQKRISSALVGFLILASVFAIINFLAPYFGFEFLQVLEIEWPTI